MASLLSPSTALRHHNSAARLSAFSTPSTKPRRRVPRVVVKAASSAEPPAAEKLPPSAGETAASPPVKTLPKKPVYSMKKGQIVRVDKEKYLNSINYLSVDHPIHFKGLDYIYEDRGEILDLKNFETGEHALVAWVGIPTAPAWLPTDMLIKSEKLNYERI